MGEVSVALIPSRTTRVPAASSGVWVRPDARRTLQLVLAAIWLLDGVLQLQNYFFTRAFGSKFIPAVAAGNPSIVARPIIWAGSLIEHQPVLADSMFALIQIGIGLGIAWRPTRKLALGASIAWACGVWWIGEGLGGVLNGTADPANGAPGAVVIYALLAVLLWPREDTHIDRSFPAAMGLGAAWARALWLVLWGSLAYFAVAGSNSSSQGLHNIFASMSSGEPRWASWLDRDAANLVAHSGLALSIVLAGLLAAVALGVYLPRRFGNATIVLAIVLALGFWVVGENFGSLFTGSGTDVNSGPLLILIAVAFWRPAATRATPLVTGPDLEPIGARA